VNGLEKDRAEYAGTRYCHLSFFSSRGRPEYHPLSPPRSCEMTVIQSLLRKLLLKGFKPAPGPGLLFLAACAGAFSGELYARKPLRATVDLSLGEVKTVELSDGTAVTVGLLELESTLDELRSAVRASKVKVSVNGDTVVLNSANYNLPVPAGGVQIDCPVTRDYLKRSPENYWGLDKDARLRLWPAGSPFIAPGTFVCPVRQRWLASDTQMSNEPTFVDGGEIPGDGEIYYHYGLDFGGCEGLDEVLAATDGIVASVGREGGEGNNVNNINIIDDRGWIYHYTHLHRIDPEVEPGAEVRKGQRLGLLGKKGTSGGWAHLHFQISYLKPFGGTAIEEAYPYVWQAYLEQYRPAVLAVARPHRLVSAGQAATLDGSKSRSLAGEITSYEWTFTDGSTAAGPVQERPYRTPGTYQELLKVVDSGGNLDYDVAVIQVIDKAEPGRLPTAIHAAYYPTLGIRAGDPVTFKVRSFNVFYDRGGSEEWDFGDGSPRVTVSSVEGFAWKSEVYQELGMDFNTVAHDPEGYAATVHSFAGPGDYLVRVERTGDFGCKAVARLHVHVSPR
ncbi:MAG: peptidoglycan DD-metalloendopeptidase family protein, partial [Candidatus Glassbacteria bacterium]|nr:peptidoglycan DD-metalloendopeptidase family protein [Candidatus Glassbacteria bacterium]